jgi:very-short-patch-repair endonuclease
LVNRQLKKMGWIPIRIWQHELREPERVVRRLCRIMRLQRTGKENGR